MLPWATLVATVLMHHNQVGDAAVDALVSMQSRQDLWALNTTLVHVRCIGRLDDPPTKSLTEFLHQVISPICFD